jgi:hypothetical protein
MEVFQSKFNNLRLFQGCTPWTIYKGEVYCDIGFNENTFTIAFISLTLDFNSN